MAAPQNKTSFRPVPSHITPLSVDVIFFEVLNRDSAQWREVPTYNTAHPNAVDWPNHKLCYVEPADEPGWERWWYVADFTTQGLYNFEAALNDQTRWPRLTQTWIIPRSVYTGPGHNSGITVPPALGKTWTRTGDNEARIGVEKLDSRFVVLRIDYEDISQPLTRQRVDNESGVVVTVTMRKVTATTAGQQADGAGFIVEVEPVNTLWAISTRDRVSGLTGGGQRRYQIHRPWPWPPVLVRFQLVVNVDGSYGYNYSMKEWDDECLIDVREFWTRVAPKLVQPATLGKTSIRWDGAFVDINIPPCLHGSLFIAETANGLTNFRNFPPTQFTDWPPTITVNPSVRPHPKGGFVVTEWIIHSPIGVIG